VVHVLGSALIVGLTAAGIGLVEQAIPIVALSVAIPSNGAMQSPAAHRTTGPHHYAHVVL